MVIRLIPTNLVDIQGYGQKPSKERDPYSEASTLAKDRLHNRTLLPLFYLLLLWLWRKHASVDELSREEYVQWITAMHSLCWLSKPYQPFKSVGVGNLAVRYYLLHSWVEWGMHPEMHKYFTTKATMGICPIERCTISEMSKSVHRHF